MSNKEWAEAEVEYSKLGRPGTSSRNKTVGDLGREFGCDRYLVSYSMPAWRVTVYDGGHGAYWVLSEGAQGVAGFTPYMTARAALDAAADIVDSRMGVN